MMHKVYEAIMVGLMLIPVIILSLIAIIGFNELRLTIGV